MNPVKIGVGKSFKGLAAYLLHDTREAGEGWTYAQHQTTANRVGWTQSYNLDDADPEKAWRLMAATAMSANDLKAAAGIKKGKSAANTAYHFSINFNPEDKTSEQLEREAVAGALKALGLDGHQALAVRHTDKEHAHVHVMVNLIDPATGLSAASKQNGKAAILSNDTRKLSTWAQKFERDNALTVTEGRLANANKRAQGEFVDARRKPRNVYERGKTETQDSRRDYLKKRFDDDAREIADRQKHLREAHKDEWAAAREGYDMMKQAIKDHARDRTSAMWAERRQIGRTAYDDQRARHLSEMGDFERNDRTAIGRIWHAAAVVKDRALNGDTLGGFIAGFSKESRVEIIARRHAKEHEALQKRLRDETAKAIAATRLETNARYAEERAAYLKACKEMKAQQDEEWSRERQKWKEHNARRKEALGVEQKRPRRDYVREQGQGWSQGRGMEPS